MTLLDTCQDDRYRAEYSTLVVQGLPWSEDPPTAVAHLNLDLLDEGAFAGWPKGDLAGAGNGWVLATTTEPQNVVLEAHDTPPPPEDDDRSGDVMETPFLTMGRGVELTQVISREPMLALRLGEPGLYRVRIQRTLLSDQRPQWLLRFWPVGDVLDPPCRLSRRPRPLMGKTDTDAELAMDLVAIALWSPGQTTQTELADRLLTSAEQIDAALEYARRHHLLHLHYHDASTVAMTPLDNRPPEVRDPFAAARERRARIRAWAQENGLTINQRTNVPAEVDELFRRHQGPLR